MLGLSVVLTIVAWFTAFSVVVIVQLHRIVKILSEDRGAEAAKRAA